MLVLNSFARVNASSEQVPYLRSCVVFAQDNKGYVSSFSTSLIWGPSKLDDSDVNYQICPLRMTLTTPCK